MFPNGWPGGGLLLLRLVAGILLVHSGILNLLRSSQWEGAIVPLLAVGSGMLLLVGFWTPMAGILVVIVELGNILFREGSPGNCLVLAALGAALAMLGPGVHSVDARLFGRKRIDIRDR